MRKIHILFLTAALVLLLGAAANAETHKITKTESYDVGEACGFSLDNIVGDYTISGWDRSVVEVNYTIVAKGSHAREKAELLDVDIDQRGDRVYVEVHYPDSRERRSRGFGDSYKVSIDFEIKVPRSCSIKVMTVSGDGEVLNLGGDLEMRSTSGDLTATAIEGNAIITTTSGDIELIGGSGKIAISTTSGDLEVRGAQGSVEMETTSGEVTLYAKQLTEGRFKTVSGDIEVVVDSPVNSGRFEMTAFNGDIDITLPGDSAFDVEAETQMGDIDNDFGLRVEKKGMFKRILSGSVNGGGALFKAYSKVGDIDIMKR